MISTALTFASRVIYSIATTTYGFFAGTAVDFTFSVKFLAVRSIISKIVPSEDLSTMFAIMGLCEAFAGVVFPYLYPTFYQYLLSDSTRDVSEMFILSSGFILISFITYS
jgi:MFS transporter, PCFT/HCP family, solute carrier family 46, member 3